MYVKKLSKRVFVINSAMADGQDETSADPMSDYLRLWGLEMYINLFKDAETLQMLSENDIKELIPVIGHRAKLTTQLKLLQEITSSETHNTHDDSIPASSNAINNLPILTDTTIHYEYIAESGLESNIQYEELPNLNTNGVYNTLSSCNEGKGLLLRYKENGLLNNAARRQLCHIIVSNELKDNPNKKVSSSRLYQLAFEINQVFKKESSAVYFTPFKSFNPRQKISAQGKLLDCYRQKRRDYIKSGIIVSEKHHSASPSTSSASNSPRPSTCTQEAIDLLETKDEDLEEKVLWLKNCMDPWSTVELYWEATAKYRLSLLTQSGISIDKYFQEFKALNQQGGLHLLLKDFNILYPDTDNKLYNNWNLIKPKIIENANKKADGVLKDLLKNCNADDEDSTDLVAFMTIPFLMNTNTIVKSKKCKGQQWRPSKQEVLDAFITHVKTAAEIDECITRRREKLQKIGINLQPFIIVVGPSPKEIFDRYVILNNVRYEVTTVLDAVDACFKIIFVLNAKYPSESKHVWQFIQKAMFKLDTKYDKVFTTVNTLITDLNIQQY
ncbi:uncharacterized protein LOC128673433 isoform X3 [Plodia interpunctella]|uniref:uncharacterized protein LOC128673433 isoform X3 n=1 Tax=Plodia interpunctella TaxID=58824 RepID=UPI0023674866|nr:uncharacterized protein LOC128673433 isoform X3 [Plodia interpunctella]